MTKDATNFSLSICQYLEHHFENLAPYKSTFGMEGPRSISSIQSIPKPVVSTIANWLDSKPDPVDPYKSQWMLDNLSLPAQTTVPFMQQVALA